MERFLTDAGLQAGSSIGRNIDLSGLLRSRFQGELVSPADPGYDQARKAWNLTVDQRPALIAIPLDAEDVIEAVRFAREQGLKIAVQSTGHGTVRPADGSLLLLTSRLNQVRVDPETRTAWVGAGLKWGAVLAEAGSYGLAPLLGSSPDVGVAGYTLGGGIGWLARKYGMACDSVISFELVTADGRVVRASQSENPDLFWALRGGGGSFGILVGMEVKLYPVPSFYGGNLVYPVEWAPEVFRRYREWIAGAPDELTSSVLLMNFPPVPAVPEPLRGKSVVMVRGCYCGPDSEGERSLRFWRDWRAPAIDDFKSRPFSQIAEVSNDPVDPSPGLTTGLWMKDLSDDAIDSLICFGGSSAGESPLVMTEVRHAGGAISRLDPQVSAYSHRQEVHLLELVGGTPTPESQAAFRAYISRFKEALEPHLSGVYMNFLEWGESGRRTRQGFSPESYRRLQALKAQYDPEDLFSQGFDLSAAG